MNDFEKSIMDFARQSSSEESWGIAQILLDMHRNDMEQIQKAQEYAKKTYRYKKITAILCAIALIAFLTTSIIFGILASGIEIEAYTTKTTVEQDTGNGSGDAIY